MDAAVSVTFSNRNPAPVTFGNDIGEQRMETPLRLFPVSQVAVQASGVFVAGGQGEKSDTLFAKGVGHPLDVFREGVGLFCSGAGQWRRLFFLLL